MVNEQPRWSWATPLEAKAQGHHVFIHQELSLAKELTVAENIYLGELPRKRFGRVDWQSTLFDKTDEILSAVSRSGFDAQAPRSGTCRSPTSRWWRSPGR
jgi:ABC-type sugar transport system ATPase subunit